MFKLFVLELYKLRFIISVYFILFFYCFYQQDIIAWQLSYLDKTQWVGYINAAVENKNTII